MPFMTLNVLTNLLRGSSTRPYPARARTPFERYRGDLVNEIGKCIFCMTCQRKCPSQCITVDNKQALWTWEAMSCVFCGVCVEACPTQCLSQKNVYRPPTVERESLTLQGEIRNPKKKGGDEGTAPPETETPATEIPPTVGPAGGASPPFS